MELSRSPRRRRGLTRGCLNILGSLGLVVAMLAACSSSTSGPELRTAPSVTDNGKRYSYDAGVVASSQWPSPCSLLTASSAAAALGTAVTLKRFHANCFYIPAANEYPTLTVTILGIGSDHGSGFDAVRTLNAKYHPSPVDVGRRAVVYSLTASLTTQLDVLAGQGLFEVALRRPRGSALSAGDARTVVIDVAQALAREFKG